LELKLLREISAMSRVDRTILVDGVTPVSEQSFRHVTLEYSRDTMEPEKFDDAQSYIGLVSFYNRRKGYGFVQNGKESYFFHVRGYCKLNPVFFKHTHKILLVVGEKLDPSKVPVIGQEIRYILKDTEQGIQARLWCYEKDYQEVKAGLDISGHRKIRCTLFRTVNGLNGEESVAQDAIVLFEGNNLDRLFEKLQHLEAELRVDGTEILFEEFNNESWITVDNPFCVQSA
jgi:hypothetical protein